MNTATELVAICLAFGGLAAAFLGNVPFAVACPLLAIFAAVHTSASHTKAMLELLKSRNQKQKSGPDWKDRARQKKPGGK